MLDTKKDKLLQDCLFGTIVEMDNAASNQIEQDIMLILKQ